MKQGQQKKQSGFSGSIGFILAAAGSAIGLGNLWRFPYLAAKDGGGLFILIYIIFALTFGFTLMTTEIAIGRKTGHSPLQAYGLVHPKFGFLGILATAVPMIIFPYYCVIGGWVTKYAATYMTGGAKSIYEAGAGNYFSDFIGANVSPIVWFLVFMALSGAVVVLGVEKGIEKASKIMMPILFLLIIALPVYSLTLQHTDADGTTRTALQGLTIYFVPSFEGLTVGRVFNIALDAMGQMFYSMSIAMGILITYGSYCKKDCDLVSSVNQIEIFDTGVALLAGMIMVPIVYAFQGNEGLRKAGPSLMFISLPAIFEQMGLIGHFVGALFFLLVFFAALTSAISLMETVASVLIDRFRMKRPLATTITFLFSTVIGLLVCFGYNLLYMEIDLPNGAKGQQLLDLLDYLSNSVIMPFLALLTCVLIGWFAKPAYVTEEVESSAKKKFGRKKLYTVMIRFIAPLLLSLILLQAFGLFRG